MRALLSVVVILIAAAGAAFATGAFPSAAGTATTPPVPPDAHAVPPPRATADPAAFVTPDRSLELDRSFLAALADRPRSVVRGLAIPIAGASLPDDPMLLPGSARDYRAGIHEGIDFAARIGTPVYAAAQGTIVRIDVSFLDWTRQVREIALDQALELGSTSTDTLDRIRGRQVWIDHGHGIVTRYAHLSAVADGWAVGDHVEARTLIGYVGSSGYPEGGPHLHFEIRIGSDYLGDGQTIDALRALVERAFF